MFFLTAIGADAAPFTYVPEGPVFNLRLPIAAVGSLMISSGQLVLNGNDVLIEAIPEAMFDSRIVLSGVAINAGTQSQGTPRAIKALVYFYAGSWLDYLSLKPMSEIIQTANGKIMSGRIVQGDDKTLSLRLSDGTVRDIAFNEITNIDSPRAYWLDIPMVNAQPTTGFSGAVIGRSLHGTIHTRVSHQAQHPGKPAPDTSTGRGERTEEQLLCCLPCR